MLQATRGRAELDGGLRCHVCQQTMQHTGGERVTTADAIDDAVQRI